MSIYHPPPDDEVLPWSSEWGSVMRTFFVTTTTTTSLVYFCLVCGLGHSVKHPLFCWKRIILYNKSTTATKVCRKKVNSSWRKTFWFFHPQSLSIPNQRKRLWSWIKRIRLSLSPLWCELVAEKMRRSRRRQNGRSVSSKIDGDAEEDVKWRIRFEELAEAMHLNTADKQYTVLQTSLRGEARARFNNAWHGIEIWSNANSTKIKELMEKRLTNGFDALTKQLFVPVESAWRQQQSYS